MSSTFQWVVDGADARGVTAHLLIELDGDAHDYDEEVIAVGLDRHNGGRAPTAASSSSHGGRRRASLTSSPREVAETHPHSQGSGGFRSQQRRPQRSSGSGSGSQHSSRGGGGRAKSGACPSWAATSVYGAEALDDSEEERPLSSSTTRSKSGYARRCGAVAPTTRRRDRATAASAGKDARPGDDEDDGYAQSEVEAEEVAAYLQGRRRLRPRRTRATVEEYYILAAEEDDGDDGDDGDDVQWEFNSDDNDVADCIEFEPRTGPGDTSSSERHSHGEEVPSDGGAEEEEGGGGGGSSDSIGDEADVDDTSEAERSPSGIPPHAHDDGRTSPVTATFYYTPNTNAEARAFAEDAMHHGGLLYPIRGGGRGGGAASAADGPATGGPAQYNKMLQKKKKRLQERSRSRDDGGDHVSFSAAVEALAMRAHRKRHLMPDYDSDHEAMEGGDLLAGEFAEGDEGGQEPEEERPIRPVGMDSDSELDETAHSGVRVRSERGDFGRYTDGARRRRAERAEGRGRVGAPFPAPQQPPGASAYGGYDASAFFISPIHQSVAEATTPWAQTKQLDGGQPRLIFFGQGGLGHTPVATLPAAPSSASGFTDAAPPTTTAATAAPAKSRRTTVGNGTSFFRVPAGVPLPPPTAAPGAHRPLAPSSRRRPTAAPGPLDSAIPIDDREAQKAIEEGMLDHLSAVVCLNDPTRQSRSRATPAPTPTPLGPRGARKRGHGDDTGRGELDGSDATSSSFSSDSGHKQPSRGGEDGSHFLSEEQRVVQRLKRQRRRRRRLERRAAEECGGSVPLGPSPSPSLGPSLELLPSSKADMREDLLESFFMDTKLHEDDFKLF